MLKSISWQEFITVFAFITSSYYIITLLLLYSAEITNLFKQRKLSLTNANKENQTGQMESFDIMGTVKHNAHQSGHVLREEKTHAENLTVSKANEPEEPINGTALSNEDETVLEAVSTLLGEIHTLIKVAASLSKDECAELFRTLLANYYGLFLTAHQPEITAFIYNSCKGHCAFEVNLSEVKSWWPNPGTASVNNQPSNKN